jgi:hypothetical protein
VLHAGDSPQGAQDLNSARQWHPQIQDDRVRTMGLREDETFVGRVRRPPAESCVAGRLRLVMFTRRRFC